MAQVYGVAVGKEERVTRVGGAANEHARDLVAAVGPRRKHLYRVQLALRVLPFRSFRQMEGISEEGKQK